MAGSSSRGRSGDAALDVHAGADVAKGAANGTCLRTTPRVRTSPSGVPSGRTKKPPTIASSTPRAAHHGSSFACPRRTRDAQFGARDVVGGDVDRRARAIGKVQADPRARPGRAGRRAVRLAKATGYGMVQWRTV